MSDDRQLLLPFGDKLLLEEVSNEEIGKKVSVMGTELGRVIAVGPGLPYGRGEYYAPSAKAGMFVLVPTKVWENANRFTWGDLKVRVVHERDCIGGFDGSS